MSMTTTTEASAQAVGALAQAAAALKRLGAACVAWHMERLATTALNAMSERELADIGLSRSEIPSAVRACVGRAHASRDL